MAIDDLSYLKSELPQVFEKKEFPKNWEKEWIIVQIIDIEKKPYKGERAGDQ